VKVTVEAPALQVTVPWEPEVTLKSEKVRPPGSVSLASRLETGIGSEVLRVAVTLSFLASGG
jgi:hypothetical protein